MPSRHTVPFVTLYALCSNSETGLTRWPYFSEREPDELPWDFITLLEQRRYRDAVNQRVQMEREYPAPTPRTRAHPSGYRAWSKWIEAEHKERYTEGYEMPHERIPLLVPGARLAFDYKVWAKWGELCFYHSEHMRAYRAHELSLIGAAEDRPQQPKVNPGEYQVFG